MSETTLTKNAPAEAAALLSAWWSRPLAEQIEEWVEAWPLARRLAADEQLRLGSHGGVAALEAAAQAPCEELLDEYERLFVGPGRTPCPPYESIWRSDSPRIEQGRLMSDASAEVAGLYRELGLAVATGTGELPDQIAVELEGLAVALDRDSADAERIAAALLHDHLHLWVPKLCDAVSQETRSPFYRELAGVTRAWVAALSARSEHAGLDTR